MAADSEWLSLRVGQCVHTASSITAVQIRKAVIAYFSSQQLLPIGFADVHKSTPTFFTAKLKDFVIHYS